MKSFLFLIITLTSSLTLLKAQQLEYGPDPEEWKWLYKPAYKTPTEIPRGDPLRKQLFDLLRPALEKISKEPLLFQGSLVSYRNWALFQGSSLNKDQQPFGYPDGGNSDTVALWLHTAEGWKLVDFSGGHSDVFYQIWAEKYGMP